MANERIKWLGLQLFADGGEGGGDGAAATGETASPAAGEARLRELGVPDRVLAKRAKRAKSAVASPDMSQAVNPREAEQPAQQTPYAGSTEPTPEDGSQTADTAPARMSWDEIMADPEYNEQMQKLIKERLRSAKSAEETLKKLAPAIELLTRKYGLSAENLDADALVKSISDDDAYYEEKALEMGVPVETAKRIDQSERETARIQAEQARAIEQQKIQAHLAGLQRQGDELKKVFPSFDLAKELANPVFARMTSPSGGISVEDAYYAIHRKEIQTAAMQVTAQKTKEQIANYIRSGQNRPVENGTSAQAPSNTTFDYATASKEQRDALKRRIREAAARGQKLYPGQ